jgi:DNA transformation protein
LAAAQRAALRKRPKARKSAKAAAKRKPATPKKKSKAGGAKTGKARKKA